MKIGATHAGITVGEDGASHQCNEDIALTKTIPGMVVMCSSSMTDLTIIASGICVDSALGAAEMLAADGIDAEVVNICTIKET